MELLQLMYFCKLAEKQHLMRTAQELYISPSSLSMTIKKLEKELGCSLFDRDGRNIVLNENGKTFYKDVSLGLKLIDGVTKELQYNKNIITLKVAVENINIWQNIFKEFEEKNSNIRIESYIHSNPKRDGFVGMDFFVGNKEFVLSDEFDYELLFSPEDYYLIVNKNHPLAKEKTINLASLENETFAVLWHDTAKAETANWQFQQAGIHPKTIVCDYLSRFISVHNGTCIAITTNLGAKYNFPDPHNLILIPITGQSFSKPRQQVVAWSKGLINKGPKKIFVAELKKICNRIQNELNDGEDFQ